jgi:predicted transcriptional regulator
MAAREDILISVEHEHVLNMLNGTKTAEARRRLLRIQPGTRVWVYSKLPRGHFELVAIADEIVSGRPRSLWDRYRSRMAISLAQFEEYFKGVDVGCVVLLKEIRPLQPALKLSAMRQISAAFHPPQFFKRLGSHGPELRSLMSTARPS